MDPFAWYSRRDVQSAIIALAKHREVAGVLESGAFLERPNALQYPGDVLALVRRGALELHMSLERWRNPMALKDGNYADLRSGWDLVLDLDCDRTEHGAVAAQSILSFLERFGLRAVSVKFTGGTGFHIGVPWESMPKRIALKPAELAYPELARAMGQYIKEKVRSDFSARLLDQWTVQELADSAEKRVADIAPAGKLDPFALVGIDPILISPRHLVRMAYSLHKSGRVSVPLLPSELTKFRPKEDALPEHVRELRPFLQPGEPEEAAALAVEAWDWAATHKLGWHESAESGEEERIAQRLRARSHALEVRSVPQHTTMRVLGRKPGAIGRTVPKELFPPCVHNALKGLSDGRKRALFLLLNFLVSMQWEWGDVEKEIVAWNERNTPPLKDGYVRTQLRWHQRQAELGKGKAVASCISPGKWIAIGLCAPDRLCGGEARTVKSPRNYPLKAMREQPRKAPR